MISLGLLGKSVQHSKSQKMYEEIFKKKIEYHLFDYANSTDIPFLDKMFKKVQGLSITAPYKEHFVKQVKLDDIAIKMGAINCIKKTDSGYEGTITDYYAVEEILMAFKKQYGELSVFLLGDGVMSRLTQICMDELNISYEIFSRKKNTDLPNMNFNKLDSGKKGIIINSCARQFVFKGDIDLDYIFWDYNYDFLPHQEKFSGLGNYYGGIELLKKQAEHAVKFWNSQKIARVKSV